MKNSVAASRSDAQQAQPPRQSLWRQGWLSVAAWMAMGLLIEGLLGFKAPAYLDDPQRRELLRLAHAHGTLLGLLLVLAAHSSERLTAPPPRSAQMALRAGALLMPIGFLLAGIWHPEGDPGPAIWIVPPAALALIYGTLALALGSLKE
jgi:hypothetical protein